MSDPTASAGATPWRMVRLDGALGAFRRVASQLRRAAPGEMVVVTPGPRWVLEPHAEERLLSVLRADPALDGVVGWWRWIDHGAMKGNGSPAIVQVGGSAGDDLRIADLLAKPASIGVIALRGRCASMFERLANLPADATLDAAGTWAVAACVSIAGGRIASLPRVCSERRRTLAEDPERLSPQGSAWLTSLALEWAGPNGLERHAARELIERWRGAPSSVPAAPKSPAEVAR